MKILARAMAKLNLTLNVKGTYDSVYHRLSSAVCTVDVFDEVCVSLRRDGASKVVRDGVIDSSNAANAVANAISETYGVCGMDIQIHKNIPFMAGMGSSSADAAAVICAACVLFDLPFDETMVKIAARCGSDIAYLVKGGLAVITGKGDDVTPVPTENVMDFLVIDGPKLSTKAVFEEYDRQPDQTIFDESVLLDALKKQDYAAATRAMGNNLQSAAQRISPRISEIAQICEELSVPRPVMTGSGGNMFLLCRNTDQAQDYRLKLAKRNVTGFVTKSTRSGVIIL